MVGRLPDSTTFTGYLSERYGESFGELGEIVTLPQSRIQFLKRKIRDNHFDLVGLYPYTMCHDWSKLGTDFDALNATDAVSVVFVSDPFAAKTIKCGLQNWILRQPFKTHLVVDLQKDWRSERSKNVRYFTRRALKLQAIEIVENHTGLTEELWTMYQNTLIRRKVGGIQRFSKTIIASHLSIEGAVLVIATKDSVLVGAIVGFVHGPTANVHLIFLSKLAYHLGTSYALYFGMLEAFEDRGCKFANLGGAAGEGDDPANGLFQFKNRWSNERRVSLLCGKILQDEAYRELCDLTVTSSSEYFPAYRTPGSPLEWVVR